MKIKTMCHEIDGWKGNKIIGFCPFYFEKTDTNQNNNCGHILLLWSKFQSETEPFTCISNSNK